MTAVVVWLVVEEHRVVDASDEEDGKHDDEHELPAGVRGQGSAQDQGRVTSILIRAGSIP